MIDATILYKNDAHIIGKANYIPSKPKYPPEGRTFRKNITS